MNIWEEFKDLSRFIQKRIQPPACWDHGLFRILSSYWLLPFICGKNPPKKCSILVWIADCWFSSVTSRNLKNNWWLSCIFRARFGVKDRGLCTYKQPVIPTRRMIRGIFVWSGSEVWSFFKNSRSKLKNLKPIAVDVLFQAYPMVPLSGWSNLAGRYL